MFERYDAYPAWRKRVTVAVLLLPIVIAVSWISYIKATEIGTGFGQGTLLSPEDNTKLIVVLVIFLFVYIFFVGMIFADKIKDFILSQFQR